MGTPKEEIAELRGRINTLFLFVGAAFVVSWVAIGFLFLQYMPAVIESKIAPLTERLTKVEVRTGELDAVLETVSSRPTLAKSDLERVGRLLATAQKLGYKPDPQKVSGAGLSVLRSISENRSLTRVAWPIVASLLDQRSSAMPEPKPLASGKTGPPGSWSTGTLPFTVKSLTVFSWTTNPDEMTTFEVRGESRNKGVTQGPSLVSFNGEGGSIDIDMHRIKNVIFRNLHVVYRGDGLELNQVYFVDCTFDLSEAPQSRELAKAILESFPVDFKTGA